MKTTIITRIPKTITILILVDAVGALASESLNENLYLLDNNRDNGSKDLGTEELKTVVVKGDELIWRVMALEPESFASLSEIRIDPQYCVPTLYSLLDDTGVVFWKGTVKKDIQLGTILHYSLEFHIENSNTRFLTCYNGPSLISSHLLG